MVRVARQTAAAVPNRYYPSARQILIVRFDPGSMSEVDVASDRTVFDEADPAPNRISLSEADVEAALNPNSISLSASQVDLAIRTSGLFSVIQEAFDANVDLGSAVTAVNAFQDGLTRTLDIQPLSFSRNVNGYRLADELTTRISWKDMPFDSRLIRAVLVLHFEGTVAPADFERGSRDGYLVPANRQNLRFIGLIDQISDSHNASGDYLNFKARDLTAPLIDTKVPKTVQKTIRPGQTLTEAIRNLLDSLELTTVDLIRGPFVRPAGTTVPTLTAARYNKLQTSAASRNQAAASGGQPTVRRNTTNGTGEESYWDAITDMCVSHGFLPMIDLDRLVLQPPRTLFTQRPEVIGQANTFTFPTPYRTSIGDNFPVRRMVYGQGLEALNFQRKLSRIKAPHVRVLGVDPNASDPAERLVSIIHPPRARTGQRVATSVGPTGNTKSIEIQNVLVHGITDRTILQNVAEAAYELMGRQLMGVKLSTSDLSSFSDAPGFDGNQDPDLLGIRAGDPVQLLVAPATDSGASFFAINELGKLVSRSQRIATAAGTRAEFSDAVAFLVAKGYAEEDAQQMVSILASANLASEFRVVTAQIVMDLEAGDVKIDIDARDYIRARADPADLGRGVPQSGVLTAADLGLA